MLTNIFTCYLSLSMIQQNYGPHFDTIAMGLPGPIEIVSRKGDETIVKDLSEHKWTYQAGLQGLDKDQLFNSAANAASASKWKSNDLPVGKMFTWYKVIFETFNKNYINLFCLSINLLLD